jgi:hypothetical protein
LDDGELKRKVDEKNRFRLLCCSFKVSEKRMKERNQKRTKKKTHNLKRLELVG